MSYSKCFICGQENFSGNENRITLRKINLDKTKRTQLSLEWTGTVCDSCMQERLGILQEQVGE